MTNLSDKSDEFLRGYSAGRRIYGDKPSYSVEITRHGGVWWGVRVDGWQIAGVIVKRGVEKLVWRWRPIRLA